jgi:hypothetical protein
MSIMWSCFFICINVKEIQTKDPSDEILSLSFDFGLLKVNTYGVRQQSILQKDSYNKKIWWEKIKKIKTC